MNNMNHFLDYTENLLIHHNTMKFHKNAQGVYEIEEYYEFEKHENAMYNRTDPNIENIRQFVSDIRFMMLRDEPTCLLQPFTYTTNNVNTMKQWIDLLREQYFDKEINDKVFKICFSNIGVENLLKDLSTSLLVTTFLENGKFSSKASEMDLTTILMQINHVKINEEFLTPAIFKFLENNQEYIHEKYQTNKNSIGTAYNKLKLLLPIPEWKKLSTYMPGLLPELPAQNELFAEPDYQTKNLKIYYAPLYAAYDVYISDNDAKSAINLCIKAINETYIEGFHKLLVNRGIEPDSVEVSVMFTDVAAFDKVKHLLQTGLGVYNDMVVQSEDPHRGYEQFHARIKMHALEAELTPRKNKSLLRKI